MKRLALGSLAFLLVLSAALPSEAAPRRRVPVRPPTTDNFDRRFLLGADFALTAGGNWSFDTPSGNDDSAPMDVGFGFDIFGEYRIARFLRAGLQFAMIWTNNDTWDRRGVDRTYFMDISARFRVPFLLWRDRVMAYVLLPIGFTLANPAPDTPVSLADRRSADTGYGMNVGAYLGVQFFAASRVAVHFNLGFLYHWFEWQSEAASVTGQSEVEVNNSIPQFGLQFGFDYAL